jgi:hypothetical protein
MTLAQTKRNAYASIRQKELLSAINSARQNRAYRDDPSLRRHDNIFFGIIDNISVIFDV